MRTRWLRHLSQARSGATTRFHRAIKKYGPNAFAHAELERTLTLDDANSAEQRWIASLRTLSPRGYNLQCGGNAIGPAHEETKEKMRVASRRQAAKKTFKEHSLYWQRAWAEIPIERRSCIATKRHERWTTDERSARGKRAHETALRSGAFERTLAGFAAMSPEARSERSKRAGAAQTPEQRSAKVRDAWAARTLDERAEVGRRISRAKKGRPNTASAGDMAWSHQHPERVPRGENASGAKLTAADVVEIRRRRADGERLRSLASDFRVTMSSISAIARMETWAHVVDVGAGGARLKPEAA